MRKFLLFLILISFISCADNNYSSEISNQENQKIFQYSQTDSFGTIIEQKELFNYIARDKGNMVQGNQYVFRIEYVENNMKYIAFYNKAGGLFIVNLTKDSLEIAAFMQEGLELKDWEIKQKRKESQE